MQVEQPYHVRVLVPTYKETLDIVAKTVHAAYNAPMPVGCLRTIYVCDDGKDSSKRRWWEILASPVIAWNSALPSLLSNGAAILSIHSSAAAECMVLAQHCS